MSLYNEFDRLTAADRVIYQKILTQVVAFKKELVFDSADFNKIYGIYSKVLQDHPELFWLKKWAKGRKVSSVFSNTLYFTPQFEEGMSYAMVPAMQRQLNSIVSTVLSRANIYRDDYLKVLYIHDYIVNNTRYENSRNRYNAYGCLVDHSAVCMGYAAAFQLFLQKLGINCGRVVGTEANKGSGKSDHEWNYCKIEGEFYFVDVTWDDPVALGGKEDILTHHYFCLSEKELSLSHRIISEGNFVPVCRSDKFNYYVYNDMYIGVYKFAAASVCVQRQLRNGRKVYLKFRSKAETNRAVADLLDNQRIYRIPGVRGSISYSVSKSGLILTATL